MATTKEFSDNAKQTTRPAQKATHEEDTQFFRSFTEPGFRNISQVINEEDPLSFLREEIIRTHSQEDLSFSDGTEHIVQPHGFNLNVNHNVTLPTFSSLFGGKKKEPDNNVINEDNSFKVDSFGQATDTMSYVKAFIKQYLDPEKMPWFIQLTSDVTVMAMLWCWLICWMCKKQFAHVVKLKHQNEGKDYPTLQDREWELDLEVCEKRLKVWSRRLVVVLTINILIRIARGQLFTDLTKHFISCVSYVKTAVPNIDDDNAKGDDVQMDNLDPSQDAADRLSKFFAEQEKEGKQPADPHADFSDHAPYVVTTIVGLCAAMTGLKTKTPLSSTILNLAKVTSHQRDNLCDMLMGAFGVVGSLLKKISSDNVISNYFYVDKINEAKTEELLNKIKDFISSHYAGTDIIDPMRLAVFTELMKDAKAHLKNLDPKSFDYRMMTEGMKELEKQSTAVEAQSKALSGDRVETVGILFMGLPGVKKSVLTDRIAKNVAYGTIPEIWKEDFVKCPETFFFNYPTDQFWDTYTYRAWVVFMDDVHQKREVAGMESPESFNIIRMINPACFVLKMAEVGAKGNNFFRSPFLFGNTNRSRETMKDLEGIHDSGAVMRRWHITVEVSVSPKFADHISLPTEKVYLDEYDANNYLEGTCIPDDFWKLHLIKYNLKTKQYDEIGEITFDELVLLTIHQYSAHVKNYYVNKQSALQSFERLKKKGGIFDLGKGVSTSRWFSKLDPAADGIKHGVQSSIIEKYSKPAVADAQADAEFVHSDESIIVESLDELLEDEEEDDTSEDSTSTINGKSKKREPPSEEDYPDKPKSRLSVVCQKLFNAGIEPEIAMKLEEDDLAWLYEPPVMQGFLGEHDLVVNSPFRFTAKGVLHTMTEAMGALEFVRVDKEKYLLGARMHASVMAELHPIKREWYEGDTAQEDWEEAVQNFSDLFSSSDNLLIMPMYIGNNWIPLCKKLERMDMADCPAQVISNLINSSNDATKKKLLMSFSCMQDLLMHIEIVCNKRKKKGQDIVTGNESFKVPETSEIGSKIWKRIKFKIRKAIDFVKENWFSLLLIGGAGAGIVYGLYKLFTAVYEMAVPQSVDVHKMTTRHPKVRAKLQSRPSSKNTLTLSSMKMGKGVAAPHASFTEEIATKLSKSLTFEVFGEKTNVSDVMAKIVNKYFYIMYINELTPDGIKCRRFAQCDNIVGRIFTMRFHYVFLLDSVRNQPDYMGATITLVNPLKTNTYTMTLEDVLDSFKTTNEAGNSDIAMFLVPGAQPGSTGTLKYYLTEADYAILHKSTAYNVKMVTSHIIAGKPLHTMSLVTRVSRATSDGLLVVKAPWATSEVEGEDMYYTLNRNVTMHVTSSKGDCGALIFVTDGNFANRCIVGSHAAGTKTTSYGSVCTYELMKSVIDLFEGELLYTDEEFPANIQPLEEPVPHGNFLSTHKFAKSDSFMIARKSKIVPSVLQGKLPEPYDEILHEPMQLQRYTNAEGKTVDPMIESLNNYGFTFPCVENKVIQEAADDFFDTFREVSGGYMGERRTLTTREALESYRNLNKVANDTSSGYPMNTPGCLDLKEAYFLAKNGNLTTPPDPERAEELLQIVEELVLEAESKMLNGTRPFFAYADFLKDEIRKRGKLARLISGSPFILLIIFRKNFGAFMDAFTEYNIEIGSAIGVNPYSEDWDAIGRKFEKFKHEDDEFVHAGAGDFKHLDGSEDPTIHNAIVEGINSWYGYADQRGTRLRRCCFVEITHSRHQFIGYLCQWESSLPSGTALTAMLNTIYTHISFRCCWIILELPIKNFRVAVYLIVLGDDNAFSVHKYYRAMFNEMTLAKVMPRIGLIYTTELKGEATQAFRRLEDIEFLKRRWEFCRHTGRYVAPLRIESIANMLNWTKEGQGVTPEQITVDNIANAMRELSLHAQETYYKWTEVLGKLKDKYLGEYSLPRSLPFKYRELRAQVLETEYYF